MTFPVVGSNIPSAYQISNSLRFNDNDSAYLSRTPASDTNRRTWTWSSWVKVSRGDINIGLFNVNNPSNNQIRLNLFSGKLNLSSYISATRQYYVRTEAIYRDVSAWYHFVVSFDTTQATASNRVKFYVNGELITNFTNSDYPTLNYDDYVNTTNPFVIGYGDNSPAYYFDGYMAEINFVDGQQLDASSFGEFDEDSGVWKPKQYAGTYGTNGFYLKFNNTGNMGEDSSGNDNTFTPTNLSGTTDVTTDTPTNNFATMNPLARATTNGTNSYTFAEGNLKLTGGASGSSGYSTIGLPKSGKWYFEHRQNSDPSSDYPQIGITENILGGAISLIGFHTTSGSDYRGKIYNTVNSNVWASGRASGDVFGWYLDFDNNKMIVHKNGSTYMGGSYLSGYDFSSRTLPSGAIDTGFWHICCMTDVSIDISFNFGNAPFSISSGNTDANGYGNFEYSPTLGGTDYLALCTQNLATALSPTIDDGSAYFHTQLYTGDGTTGRSITNDANAGNFQPDWLWIKERSSTSANRLTDSSRGVNKVLLSENTTSELTRDEIGSYDTDGFTIDGTTDGVGAVNENTQTYVAWQWKANGGTTSSNTDGSITSTVQANTTAGFSIVTYTGTGANATVGHSLGVKPDMVIVKNRSSATDWGVQMANTLGFTNALRLNLTDAYGGVNGAGWWNDTAPTTTTVSIGTRSEVNTNGNNYVMYCFNNVEGYSKFGSYTGNANASGTFVYLGFRPQWIMIKKTNAGSQWNIHDTKRNQFNVDTKILQANQSIAESTTSNADLDILSNGFKLRSLDDAQNGSGDTYIYMAFAENPFVTSGATPVTAR